MKHPNTILLIENDRAVRESTQVWLETHGYEIFGTGCIREAHQILMTKRIYLVIIDMRLQNDNDQSDMTGLDFVAKLGFEVAKLLLTGFATAEIARRVLGRYYASTRFYPLSFELSKSEEEQKNSKTMHYEQNTIFDDIVAKQDGPQELLRTVKQIFQWRIHAQINFDLEIEYEPGLTLDILLEPLRRRTDTNGLEPTELEELLRRLFLGESKIKLYHLVPGRGGSGVILVKPTYPNEDSNGIGHLMTGALLVVKFGLVKEIEQEIAAYRQHVEPFAGRRSTVLREQTVRTHYLAGCKWLFVGHSANNLQDFNSYYRNPDTTNPQLGQTIRQIFTDTCGVWYQGKRDTNEADGTLVHMMLKELSLNVTSHTSELNRELTQILQDKIFHRVGFECIGSEKLRVKINNHIEELPNPICFVAHHQERLPQSAFTAITHGDLNGRNLFIDTNGASWLIDFSRTGWGPALRDTAELESAIKFELIQSVNLPALLAFEAAILAPHSFSQSMHIELPTIASTQEFERALTAIQTIRQAACAIDETDEMRGYYALLLFYALKLVTWKGIVSIDSERKPFRQRHAFYSASILAKKFL